MKQITSNLEKIKKGATICSSFFWPIIIYLNFNEIIYTIDRTAFICGMHLTSECNFLSYYIFFVLLAIDDNALNVSAKNLPKTIIKNP